MGIKKSLYSSLKQLLKLGTNTSYKSSGAVFKVTRYLGSTSTLALLSAHANLSINAAGLVSTSGIATGQVQSGVIRESLNQRSIEYPFQVIGGTMSAAALISTPSAYSQAAGSLCYQKAVADRPGTWSKGTGTDAALFTVDSVTGIWTISEDQAAGTRRLPLVFTPSDGSGAVSQNITVTLNAVGATQAQSDGARSDFTGADGVLLTTKSGWTQVNKPGVTGTRSPPVMTGTGKLRGSTENYESPFSVLYNTVAPAAGQKIVYTIEPATTADYLPFGITFLAAAGTGGYDNAVTMAFYARPGALQYVNGTAKIRNGGTEQEIPVNGGLDCTFRDNGTALIEVSVSADGKTLTVQMIGGNRSPVVCTLDLSDKPYLGSRYGFSNGGNGYPQMLHPIHRIASVDYSNAKVIMALAEPVITTPPGVNTKQFKLTWATGGIRPTAFRHRFRVGSAAWSPWLIGESVVADDGTATYLASYPGKGDYETEIGAYNDTTSTVSIPSLLVGYPTYPGEIGGHFGVSNYYDPNTAQNDWGTGSELNNEPNNVYIPHGGINTKVGTDPATGQPYVDIITTDRAVTFTVRPNSEGVVLVETGGTQHKVRITKDATQPYTGNMRGFRYTGAKLTKFSVSRGGATGYVQSEVLDALALTKAKGYRTHNMRKRTSSDTYPLALNGAPNDRLTTQYWLNAPIEYLVGAINEMNVRDPSARYFWHTINLDMSDAEAQYEAEKVRDLARPGVVVILEYGVEVGWSYGKDYMFVEGVRRGYRTTNDVAAMPQSQIIYRGGGNGIGMSPAVPAGSAVHYYHTGTDEMFWFKAKRNVAVGADLVEGPDFEVSRGVDLGVPQIYAYGGNGVGWAPAMTTGQILVYGLNGTVVAYRAKRPVAAGADIVIGDDFERVPETDNYSAIKAKLKSRRFNEILTIWENVWGAGSIGTPANPGRLRPALMGQRAGQKIMPSLALDLAASPQLASRLFYVGWGVYYGDKPDATTKEQVGINCRQSMNELAAELYDTARDIIRAGYVPAWYEGGRHSAKFQSPVPGYVAAEQDWRRNATGPNGPFQLSKEWAQHMTKVGGVTMRYTSFGENWGLMDTIYDTTNPTLLGHLAGLA